MDRSRFIEMAPYYYAGGILSAFRQFPSFDHATKIAIKRLWWDKETQESDPDEIYNFLENDVLFDAGIAFLADRDILTIIADDFGPDLYSKGVNFDDGCIALTADRSLPFYKCNLDTGEQWLREALRSVNTKYRDLRIGPNDFAKPDIEWEPLPIDRNDRCGVACGELCAAG